MKTTNVEKEKLEATGVKFDSTRLELAKKDDQEIPQSTGKHVVTILRDEKRTDIRLYTSCNGFKEVVGIRYWFNEDGAEKYYDVPLFDMNDKPHYLIAGFADINEGNKLEMSTSRRAKAASLRSPRSPVHRVNSRL
jgi:hypothetical protein